MIRRAKTTVFMDAKESTTVLELKKMVQGITKRAPEDMKLYKEDQVLLEYLEYSILGIWKANLYTQFQVYVLELGHNLWGLSNFESEERTR